MSTKCRQPSGRPLSPWLLQPLPKQRLSGPSRHFSKRLQAPHGLLPAHASGGENANDHLFGSSLSGHGSHEGTCGSRRQATEQIGFCVALRQGLCCLGTLRSHERPTASHGVWHGMVFLVCGHDKCLRASPHYSERGATEEKCICPRHGSFA